MIGHGTGREGGFFGFGGPVNKTSGGCDDVHFTRATGMSFDSVQAKKADLAIAGKALSSLTLAACNSGVDPQMVQQLADALGVVVKSFSDPVTMCLGGKPGSFTRGKVLSGSEVAGAGQLQRHFRPRTRPVHQPPQTLRRCRGS